MPDLLTELEKAKARVAQLERQVLAAPCAEVGHRWRHIGGRCACCDDACRCSIPVNECEVCKDCDYGENEEARRVIKECFDGR